MKKKLIRILNYLTIFFGAHKAIPNASLDLCDWVKVQYPGLTTEELLIITAALIRSSPNMYQSHPTQLTGLNEAVTNLLSTRNQQ
jgi:hypothetical protein